MRGIEDEPELYSDADVMFINDLVTCEAGSTIVEFIELLHNQASK